MTSAELESIKQSIPLVTSLFASGTEQTGPQWNDPADNYAGSRFINYAEGIPPDYAMPYANGGKKVLRKDINAIGNIASRELYLLQHGGYHTFNPEVAKAIKGYPYGAFLDWYQPSTGWLRKVRCVKDGGNCFTPIDDPDHGIGSGEPHWEIADIMDSVAASTENDTEKASVSLRKVTPPDGEEETLYYGGFRLEILPTGLTLQPGKKVESKPWTAPFDSMISFNFVRNGKLYPTSPLGPMFYLNPYVWTLPTDASGMSSVYRGVGLRVYDGVGEFRLPLQGQYGTIWAWKETDINFDKRPIPDSCPRMFVKKGTSISLVVENLENSSFTLVDAFLCFSVYEVT